jgi:hypothetical protein
MQDPQKSCGNCGYPALVMCFDCGIYVYCGKECQEKYMSVHLTVCKELELERAMVQTADTIQKAYFVFCKLLFEKTIMKVKERDHELVLHQQITD